MARFIFVTGGVVSSLGKGLLSASLGALLQARGYKVRIRKFDPYLNVDPGTMSPYQHGEVYVTDDGAETDLDLGHYERFTGVSSQPVGQCHHRPHLSRHHRQGAARRLSRRDRPGHSARHQRHQGIRAHATSTALDFVICEIGGTVGDIESLPFIESIRQLRNDLGRDQTVSVHTTLVPWIAAAGELKTKPTQQSVRELSSLGVQPDVLLCRCDRPLPDSEREKIALVLQRAQVGGDPGARRAQHLRRAAAISSRRGSTTKSCARSGSPTRRRRNSTRWPEIMDRIDHSDGEVTIGVVGKYVGLPDAYKSLREALVHGGIANRAKVNIQWIDAELFEHPEADIVAELEPLHGILVPGGFGERGSEGKIASVKFARERDMPFFGICLGMQMACIEGARNQAGISEASTTEFGETSEPVVGMITEWMSEEGLQKRAAGGDLGGTMRLGAYPAKLDGNSVVRSIYGADEISERHRHRYEVNVHYRDALEGAG